VLRAARQTGVRAPAAVFLPMPVVIHTDRLILRKPILDDLGAFAQQFADPEVTRFLGDGSPRSPERVERGLHNGLLCWDRLGFGPFTVLSEGRVIGDCMLYPIAHSGVDAIDFDARGPEIEIGYRLARRAWGRGLATEAARAVLEWATTDPSGPGLDNLLAVTHPDNIASQRVLEKIGMVSVGSTEAFYGTPTQLFAQRRADGSLSVTPPES